MADVMSGADPGAPEHPSLISLGEDQRTVGPAWSSRWTQRSAEPSSQTRGQLQRLLWVSSHNSEDITSAEVELDNPSCFVLHLLHDISFSVCWLILSTWRWSR